MRERFQELEAHDAQFLLEEISKYNKEVIQRAYKIKRRETTELNLSPEIFTVLRERRKKLRYVRNIWNDSGFCEYGKESPPICEMVEKGMNSAFLKKSVTIIKNPIVFLTSEMHFGRDEVNGYWYNRYPCYRSRLTMQAWYRSLLSRAVLVDFAVLKNNPSENFSRNIGDPKNGIILDKILPETVVRFTDLERAKKNTQDPGYALPLVARRFRDELLAHEIKKYVKKEEGENLFFRLIELIGSF